MQIFGMTGEALGQIDASAATTAPPVPQPKNSPEPEWKRSLAHTPSVSVRRGIVEGSSPSKEPTSTLVLTSLNSHFVDIRFCLDGPATSGPHYWAFAGTSTTEFPNSTTKDNGDSSSSQGSGNLVTFPSAQCTWTRSVDSRGDLETPDQGTCFLLQTGEVLEVGMSVEGVMYQELWDGVKRDDVKDLAVLGSGVVTNKGQFEVNRAMLGTLDQGSRVISVVALLKKEEEGKSKVNGVMVRVGPFSQGIVALPPGEGGEEGGEGNKLVCVERWACLGHVLNDKDDTWIRDPRSNLDLDAREKGVIMPCEWIADQQQNGNRSVGEVFHGEYYGGQWTVVEAEYPE